MYAIIIDIDTDIFRESYDTDNYTNAYAEIENILKKHGFPKRQGGVYFSDADMDAVKAVTATQKLARTFSWFPACVRDIRLLRIEDDNDLMPAIDEVLEF